MRASISLLAVLVFTVLPNLVHAQLPDKHAPIGKYLDSSTVLVGWLDLAELDLPKTAEFFGEIGIPAPNEDDLQKSEAVRTALVNLKAQRVYWISDLATLNEGPAKLVIPSDNPAAVGLMLDSLAEGGSSFGFEPTEGAVIGGSIENRETLKKADAKPSAELLAAISACDQPHGIAFSTPPYVTMSVMGILKSTINESDISEIARLAESLSGIQWIAASTQLPPNQAQIEIRAKSPKAAETLRDFASDFLDERLKDHKGSLDLKTTDASVTLAATSVDEAVKSLLGVREALSFRPQNTMNSIKQIALALHNYASAYQHLPPQSLVDAEGNRLLSWRVLILPYLEQAALYEQFHLDEPWDSPHNLELAKTIPAPYLWDDANNNQAANGAMKTRIVAPMTKDSAFGRPGKPLWFRDFLDGTSNTLWFVEAAPENAVIWTKPQDLPIDVENPYKSIAGDADVFFGSFVDGSAHALPNRIKSEVLNALITIDGREIIKSEDLR